jgi:hypothetical protein
MGIVLYPRAVATSAGRLAGHYDTELSGDFPGAVTSAEDGPLGKPTLFLALEEQLALKLERGDEPGGSEASASGHAEPERDDDFPPVQPEHRLLAFHDWEVEGQRLHLRPPFGPDLEPQCILRLPWIGCVIDIGGPAEDHRPGLGPGDGPHAVLARGQRLSFTCTSRVNEMAVA